MFHTNHVRVLQEELNLSKKKVQVLERDALVYQGKMNPGGGWVG